MVGVFRGSDLPACFEGKFSGQMLIAKCQMLSSRGPGFLQSGLGSLAARVGLQGALKRTYSSLIVLHCHLPVTLHHVLFRGGLVSAAGSG